MVDLVREQLDVIAELYRRNRVRRLFLIGSATSGGFDAARSDLAFLVDFESHERQGFDDAYFRLLQGLEELFNRRVDLIEASALCNPSIIASVNRTKQMLYAA